MGGRSGLVATINESSILLDSAAKQTEANEALLHAQELEQEYYANLGYVAPTYDLSDLGQAATTHFAYDNRGQLTETIDAANFPERGLAGRSTDSAIPVRWKGSTCASPSKGKTSCRSITTSGCQRRASCFFLQVSSSRASRSR